MVAASSCSFPSAEYLRRVQELPYVKELCDAERAMPQEAPLHCEIVGFVLHVEEVFDPEMLLSHTG